MTELFK